MVNGQNEVWKAVIGYEGVYEISSLGRVKRIIYKGRPVSLIVKAKLHQRGYLVIGLRNNHTRRWFLVHRLVAIAFIHNPENKCDVNHKDSNKLNNNVTNLEWNTRKENIMHSWAVGTSKINSGCFKKGFNRWLLKKEEIA